MNFLAVKAALTPKVELDGFFPQPGKIIKAKKAPKTRARPLEKLFRDDITAIPLVNGLMDLGSPKNSRTNFTRKGRQNHIGQLKFFYG
jgi:hypothetical protein